MLVFQASEKKDMNMNFQKSFLTALISYSHLKTLLFNKGKGALLDLTSVSNFFDSKNVTTKSEFIIQ